MKLENSSEGIDFANNFKIANKHSIHSSVDAPLCDSCLEKEFFFFDPTCPGCSDLLHSPETRPAELFAILRQWTPQTQQNIEVIIQVLINSKVNINDRDGLTDMTMLMFAAKSGTNGIGDANTASHIVKQLIERGADVRVASKWTNMTALHYAAFFDVGPVVKVLLEATQGEDVNLPCSEFDMGSPLHLACQNVSATAASVLLDFGADINQKDNLRRTPAECIPEDDCVPQQQKVDLIKLKQLMKEQDQTAPSSGGLKGASQLPIEGQQTLQSMGLMLGDRVLVGGVKKGRIRYCGPTEFANGVWAGIELDMAEGKNSGMVAGKSYFQCPPKYGIFAPISKVAHLGLSTPLSGRATPTKKISSRSPRVGHISAKIDTGLRWAGTGSLSRSRTASDPGEIVDVGDRVIVAGQRKGVIRFYGETKFASGLWYGVELDKSAGKNDGSVSGEQYFTCRPKHGVFAPASRIKRIHGSTESLDSINLGLSGSKSNLSRSNSQNSLTDGGRSHTPINTRTKPSMMLSPWRSNGSQDLKLCEGMSVFCNGELGVVRYIGPAHFADGTWIGVELRVPKGKNDGTVQGQRYFTCKPDHGLLVRPSKVSVRGINGAKLLGEKFEG